MDFSEEEIIALRTRASDLVESLQNERERLNNTRDGRLNSKGLKSSMNYCITNYREVMDPFNELVESRGLEDFSRMDEVEKFDEELSPSQARGEVGNLKRNMKVAVNIMESLEGKSVETSRVARLTSLENSIEDKLGESHKVLSRNLSQAISALEDGHTKPASVTASGIVDHVMSELRQQLNASDWDDAIEELEEQDILDTQTDGRIHRALKQSRNNLSHDLEKDPDVENSLLMISGAVQLLSQIKEIDDIDVFIEKD